MKIIFRSASLLLFCFAINFAHAQNTSTDTLVLTLQQVVDMAKQQAPASKLAATVLQNRYWQYRTYKADYLPLLKLNAQLPNFDRSISAVTQNDGTALFVKRNIELLFSYL